MISVIWLINCLLVIENFNVVSCQHSLNFSATWFLIRMTSHSLWSNWRRQNIQLHGSALGEDNIHNEMFQHSFQALLQKNTCFVQWSMEIRNYSRVMSIPIIIPLLTYERKEKIWFHIDQYPSLLAWGKLMEHLGNRKLTWRVEFVFSCHQSTNDAFYLYDKWHTKALGKMWIYSSCSDRFWIRFL